MLADGVEPSETGSGGVEAGSAAVAFSPVEVRSVEQAPSPDRELGGIQNKHSHTYNFNHEFMAHAATILP